LEVKSNWIWEGQGIDFRGVGGTATGPARTAAERSGTLRIVKILLVDIPLAMFNGSVL
jgi:hypothetical protein